MLCVYCAIMYGWEVWQGRPNFWVLQKLYRSGSETRRGLGVRFGGFFGEKFGWEFFWSDGGGYKLTHSLTHMHPHNTRMWRLRQQVHLRAHVPQTRQTGNTQKRVPRGVEQCVPFSDEW